MQIDLLCASALFVFFFLFPVDLNFAHHLCIRNILLL